MPATAVRPGSTGLAEGHPGGLHVVHLGSPALRTAGRPRPGRAARQLARAVLRPGVRRCGRPARRRASKTTRPGSLARFVMLFTPIWWLWVQFTFYADRHEIRRRGTPHRHS